MGLVDVQDIVILKIEEVMGCNLWSAHFEINSLFEASVMSLTMTKDKGAPIEISRSKILIITVVVTQV